MGTKEALTDLGMKTMNLAHRGLLFASGGRLGRSFGSMPVVELRTIGRTSGKQRSTMLTAPVHSDDRYVLVASKGGDDRHPQWYLNLKAGPEVELTVNGETLPMTARTASAEEKAELWPDIVAAYKGYAGYQKRTDRDIPVVICEPRPA
jgi:deazaflavin-dependent oxidoreductase (nitroreductase family)